MSVAEKQRENHPCFDFALSNVVGTEEEEEVRRRLPNVSPEDPDSMHNDIEILETGMAQLPPAAYANNTGYNHSGSRTARSNTISMSIKGSGLAGVQVKEEPMDDDRTSSTLTDENVNSRLHHGYSSRYNDNNDDSSRVQSRTNYRSLADAPSAHLSSHLTPHLRQLPSDPHLLGSTAVSLAQRNGTNTLRNYSPMTPNTSDGRSGDDNSMDSFGQAVSNPKLSSPGGGSSLSTQPRAKREFVPDNKKDAVYWNKRHKNNQSARVSRAKKRKAEFQMSVRIRQLEAENLKLKHENAAMIKHFNVSQEYLNQLVGETPTPTLQFSGKGSPPHIAQHSNSSSPNTRSRESKPRSPPRSQQREQGEKPKFYLEVMDDDDLKGQEQDRRKVIVEENAYNERHALHALQPRPNAHSPHVRHNLSPLRLEMPQSASTYDPTRRRRSTSSPDTSLSYVHPAAAGFAIYNDGQVRPAVPPLEAHRNQLTYLSARSSYLPFMSANLHPVINNQTSYPSPMALAAVSKSTGYWGSEYNRYNTSPLSRESEALSGASNGSPCVSDPSLDPASSPSLANSEDDVSNGNGRVTSRGSSISISSALDEETLQRGGVCGSHIPLKMRMKRGYTSSISSGFSSSLNTFSKSTSRQDSLNDNSSGDSPSSPY